MLPKSLSLLLMIAIAVMGVTMGLDRRTVIEYVNETPELSTLKGLLQQARLDLVLGTPQATYTLFAPTDAAFSKLPPSLLQQLAGDPALLQQTLLTHVLNTAVISLFLTNDQTETTLSTIPLRFNIYNETYTAEGNPIIQGDVVLKNGVVHVIDGVILPAEGDILRQILKDDAEFEDLTAALAVTNLLEDLEFEAITVFAPLNSAFQRYFTVNQLPDNLDVTKDLLLNHIVNGTYYTAGLNSGFTLTTMSGHTLNFLKSPTTGALLVNNHPTDGVIYATNGIIHVMTEIMAP